jgi:hypothetical protein
MLPYQSRKKKSLAVLTARKNKTTSRGATYHSSQRGGSQRDLTGGMYSNAPRVKLAPWRENETRNLVDFVDSFEELYPLQSKKDIGLARCSHFRYFIESAVHLDRISSYLQGRKVANRHPRWSNMRKAFLVGDTNIAAFLSTAVTQLQGLKQISTEDPSRFLLRLRQHSRLITDIAIKEPNSHEILSSIGERNLIRTFYMGLSNHHHHLKETIMRKSLPVDGKTPKINNFHDLGQHISRETSIVHTLSANITPGDNARSSRKSDVRQDASFQAQNLEPESEGEQTSAQFSGVSTRSILQDRGVTPARERKEVVTRSSKETLHSNTQYYDSGDDNEASKPKVKAVKVSKKRSATTRPLSKPPPVPVDDASSSSSEEEAEEEVLPRPKRTRSAPSTIALNKMVQAANDTMTRLAQFQHPPAPFQQAPSPAHSRSSSKYKQICFACATEIEDWRTHKHECTKSKQKILTCPHCKISLKAGSQLSTLFTHIGSCAMKTCSACNSTDHSSYYCPKLQCTTCKKFGHSRILHSLSSGGGVLIASNSADNSA